MDKRYQVFVSSTFEDLKEERQRVFQALMGIDCIPAGMELFPATDEEQFQFIKRIIDDCDYYIIIVGGRYGSLTSKGNISYTEKEYKYAKSKKLSILAFIHDHPGTIPADKYEQNPTKQKKLEAFRKKLKKSRVVKFWSQAADLPGLVLSALSMTIKNFPAVGWVRADKVANEDLLIELNEIRKENGQLKEQVKTLESKLGSEDIPNLASMDDSFAVSIIVNVQSIEEPLSSLGERFRIEHEVSWKELFKCIVDPLFGCNDNQYWEMENNICGLADISALRLKHPDCNVEPHLDQRMFEIIRNQFVAHKLIKVFKSGVHTIWSLTEKGERLACQLVALRSSHKSG